MAKNGLPAGLPNMVTSRSIFVVKDNKDNSRHLGRKYARIMSADKYQSIFSRQMATIFLYIRNFVYRGELVVFSSIFPQ